MASVTHEIATVSTLNVTSYASAAFTPAVGDLLVVYVLGTTTVTNGSLSASGNGVTSFTLVSSAFKGTSADILHCYVADQLTTGAASMTVTWDCTADSASGTVISVAAVAGMTFAGAAAVRQSAKQENQVSGTTPAPTFGAACLTGNPTLVGWGSSSAAGNTQPAGWTEAADVTYATPTTGGGYAFRDSGFTGTTITWGSTIVTIWCVIALELDASAPAAAIPPIIVMPPRRP